MGGEGLEGYVADALHLELLIAGIHGLGESVGEEEDGGAGEDAGFLQGVLPR